MTTDVSTTSTTRLAMLRMRSRATAIRRQLKVLAKNPSNRGWRARKLLDIVRFEVNAVRGQPTLVAFGDRSTIYATKEGNSSSRAAFARLPDWPEMEIWQHWLDAETDFVDVGANVGLYSIVAAEQGARVTAIEPSSDMVRRIEANAACNGLHDIRILEGAAMDRQGTIRLDGADANRMRADWSDGDQTIEAFRLDDVVDGQRRVALKIDVEGNERLVLEGARALLSNDSVELMQLEWNDASESALGEGREPAARMLRDSGFTLFRALANGTMSEFLADEMPPYGRDVFAARGRAAEFLRAASWVST